MDARTFPVHPTPRPCPQTHPGPPNTTPAYGRTPGLPNMTPCPTDRHPPTQHEYALLTQHDALPMDDVLAPYTRTPRTPDMTPASRDDPLAHPTRRLPMDDPRPRTHPRPILTRHPMDAHPAHGRTPLAHSDTTPCPWTHPGLHGRTPPILGHPCPCPWTHTCLMDAPFWPNLHDAPAHGRTPAYGRTPGLRTHYPPTGCTPSAHPTRPTRGSHKHVNLAVSQLAVHRVLLSPNQPSAPCLGNLASLSVCCGYLQLSPAVLSCGHQTDNQCHLGTYFQPSTQQPPTQPSESATAGWGLNV